MDNKKSKVETEGEEKVKTTVIGCSVNRAQAPSCDLYLDFVTGLWAITNNVFPHNATSFNFYGSSVILWCKLLLCYLFSHKFQNFYHYLWNTGLAQKSFVLILHVFLKVVLLIIIDQSAPSIRNKLYIFFNNLTLEHWKSATILTWHEMKIATAICMQRILKGKSVTGNDCIAVVC